MKTTIMVLTFAAAAVAMTADVQAATIPALPRMAADSPVDERLAQANALQQEAEALFDDSREWKRAARLMEQSAELRSESDPGAYEQMAYAARLRWAAGDRNGAKKAFERAGELALARGEIADGARAYIDAAFAASAVGRAPEARKLITFAEGLAQSPQLSEEQRRELIARIKGQSPAQVTISR
ncbi:MAG: hypothetical protein WEF86_15015 [Gemmatimonadota bacterium]